MAILWLFGDLGILHNQRSLWSLSVIVGLFDYSRWIHLKPRARWLKILRGNWGTAFCKTWLILSFGSFSNFIIWEFEIRVITAWYCSLIVLFPFANEFHLLGWASWEEVSRCLRWMFYFWCRFLTHWSWNIIIKWSFVWVFGALAEIHLLCACQSILQLLNRFKLLITRTFNCGDLLFRARRVCWSCHRYKWL